MSAIARDEPPAAAESSFHDGLDKNGFDDAGYVRHHYLNGVGAEDAQTIAGTVGWVAQQFKTGQLYPRTLEGRHLEIGPSLAEQWSGILEPAMAPGAPLDRVEYGLRGVEALQQALLRPLDPRWLLQEAAMVAAGGTYGPYWQGALYAVRARSVVKQGSIYELPEEAYASGTMFYVACSIGSKYEMFQAAVAGFLGSLRPGAPWVAGFMEESEGYPAGKGGRFQSCPVTLDQIHETLSLGADVQLCERTTAADIQLHEPTTVGAKVRTGYKAMVSGRYAPPVLEIFRDRRGVRDFLVRLD
jgi:hypothetical protein